MKKLSVLFMIIAMVMLASVLTAAFAEAWPETTFTNESEMSIPTEQDDIYDYEEEEEKDLIEHIPTPEEKEVWRQQEMTMIAGELLGAYFDKEYGGEYPDEYGGMYTEQSEPYNITVLQLTDISPEMISKYNRIFGKYSEYVKYEQVRFSYNYLKKELDENISKVEKEHGSPAVWCVDEVSNGVWIMLDSTGKNAYWQYSDEAVDIIKAVFSKKGISAIVEKGEPIVLDVIVTGGDGITYN